MSSHRIKPGKEPKLHKIDTAGTPDWSKEREAGEARMLELKKELLPNVQTSRRERVFK